MIGASASHIRAMWTGGYAITHWTNGIQFITIATTGNFVDFGDLTTNKENPSGNINSPTRGFWAGGDQAGNDNERGGYMGATSDSHGGLS